MHFAQIYFDNCIYMHIDYGNGTNKTARPVAVRLKKKIKGKHTELGQIQAEWNGASYAYSCENDFQWIWSQLLSAIIKSHKE